MYVRFVPLVRLLLFACSLRLSANDLEGVVMGVVAFTVGGGVEVAIVGVAAYVGVAKCVVLLVVFPFGEDCMDAGCALGNGGY